MHVYKENIITIKNLFKKNTLQSRWLKYSIYVILYKLIDYALPYSLTFY